LDAESPNPPGHAYLRDFTDARGNLVHVGDDLGSGLVQVSALVPGGTGFAPIFLDDEGALAAIEALTRWRADHAARAASPDAP
jgi:hypothetical protein